MSRLFLLALTLVATPSFAAVTIPEIDTSIRASQRAAWEQYLRDERALQLQRLDAYAQAGVFPQNTTIPGFGHQFLDANDVPCAMANLIWQSGHEDLVRETARTHNDVVLGELTDGPLVDWMLTSGLTREEVAIIQVPAMEVQLPLVQDRQIAENERVRLHLLSVEALLVGDTEPSIALALDRLGDRIYEPPPTLSS
jgi:hypothetical protein